jgi:antagonist of KipI
LHYPAPRLRFAQGAIIALAGSDFGAQCGHTSLPLYRRIALAPGSTVHFAGKRWGQRCYLAVAGGFTVEPVLGSTSTNLKSGFGGWQGRALLAGDELPFHSPASNISNGVVVADWFIYPWYWYRNESKIAVLPGPEWDDLAGKEKTFLLNQPFSISRQADRMGYIMNESVPDVEANGNLLSSGVLYGTVQLLPAGKLLLLMADHQTTGGYPRILQVANAQLHKLAQLGPGDQIGFRIINRHDAERQWLELNEWVNQTAAAIRLNHPLR